MNWNEMEELLQKSQLENNSALIDSESFSHQELSDRLRKTFYYSPNKTPVKETISFPITKATVESFRKVAPGSFGKLGHRYASRVARDACISPCSLLLAMIYLERLSNRNPEYLENISSSNLFLVSMMVASKFLYDEGISEEVFNDEWAASGLSDTDHVNNLEAQFLKAIDWRVLVRKAEFTRMLELFERRLAMEQGLDRGWFSYTDMDCLAENPNFLTHMKFTLNYLTKTICACFAVYGSVILTTIGAVMIARSIGDNMRSSVPGAPYPLPQSVNNNGTVIQLEIILNKNDETLKSVLEAENVTDIDEILEEMDNQQTQLDLKLDQPTAVPFQPDVKANSVQVFTLLETVFFISNLPKSTNSDSNVFNGYCPNCQKPGNQQENEKQKINRKRVAELEIINQKNVSLPISDYITSTRFNKGLELKCKPPSNLHLFEDTLMLHDLHYVKHSTMSTPSPFITIY